MDENDNVVEFTINKKSTEDEEREKAFAEIAEKISSDASELFGVMRTKDGDFKYIAVQSVSSGEEAMGAIEMLAARVRQLITGT